VIARAPGAGCGIHRNQQETAGVAGFRFAAPLALLLVAATLSPARGDEWQLHADLGGQLDSSSHAVVDAGVRRGALSANFYTDTLDLRWSPESPAGRAWIALRGEAYDAALLVAPWSNGAPDPARSLSASYGGIELGWVRYLPRSVYGGLSVSERVYYFAARGATRIPVPGITSLATADLVFGRWTPSAHVWLRAGADLQDLDVQPHVAAEAIWQPQPPGELPARGAAAVRGWIAPRIELRAGAAYGQSFLTATRLGGLNPYVVPLAGAGWAEFWVQNYAAMRLAISWATRWSELGVAVDGAAFDQQLQSGFALLLRGRWRRFFVQTDLGYAPWIVRAPGISRLSAWVMAGADWGPFHRAR
jgi:hypothetical protein